jgi:hypothetical protein
MSKRTRRSQRRAVPSASAPRTTGEQAPASTRPTFVPRTSAAAKVDLAQEYHYVFADLQKIAVIAAAMFVLLFALNFILR